MEIIFLLGRILLGGFFIANGFNHFKNAGPMAGGAAARKVPSPKLAVILSGALMLLGGIGVLLGIYPVYSIILLLIFLVPTTFIMHPYWKESDQALRMNEQINFMKNIALIGALLMLTMLPLPWPLSIIH